MKYGGDERERGIKKNQERKGRNGEGRKVRKEERKQKESWKYGRGAGGKNKRKLASQGQVKEGRDESNFELKGRKEYGRRAKGGS